MWAFAAIVEPLLPRLAHWLIRRSTMVRSPRRALFIVTLCAACLFPITTHAQIDSAQFERLQSRVKIDQLVIVTDSAGQKTVGKIKELTGSGLVIDVRTENPRDGSGRPRYSFADAKRFDASDVQRIAKPGPIWDGAVKGAAIGLASMMIIFRAYPCSGCGNAYWSALGVGAGIGLGFDAAFGPKTLYQKRP
jgi:hypothetical protein